MIYKVADLFVHIRNGMNIKQEMGAVGLPITRIETIANAEINLKRVGYAGLTLEQASNYLLEDGEILFSHINSVSHIGKCALYTKDMGELVHGMNLLSFKPNQTLLFPKYALHALRSQQFKDQLAKSIKKAVNQASVSISDIKNITLNIPPLLEQKRIAAVLDKAYEIKAKREQAIAKLDALTSSTFTELFLKDGKWPALKLMEVCTTTSGGTPKRDVADYYGGEIFWVKSGELAADLVMNTEETLTFEGVKNSSAKVMPPKTVLLAMYGATIGAVSMLGISAATNQAICCITVGEKLLPEFLVYYLKSIKHNLIKLAVGGAQPNINQDIIRNLLVPIPPASLQQMFLERATAIRQQIIKAEMSLSQIKTAIASLQHQAFTSGFN